MSDNIKVAVRLRNLITREIENKAIVHWAAKDPFSIQQINSSTSPFCFDRVFAGHEGNEVVYSEFCSPIVDSVINGFNGTIFAYGQTSSGKTYTLMGDNGFELGIAHHTVFGLFEHMQNMPDREFLLRVSYMEIYNEMVIDLLSDSNENLKLQEDQYGTIKVNKLTELIVQEPQQVLELMKKGQKKRTTGETVMNNKSSRSHSIFRMIIESGLRGAENAAVNVSQFNIIDLAGSEKAGLNKGTRFKEGININKSLFMLSQVISQLSAEKEHQFINYRDSKLTRILQNSLGGNALTAIICTVTPASLEETTSTLKFALRAKKIKNKPKVNEIQTEQALLKKYANKIKKLTEELEATKEEKDQEAKICKNLQQQIENLKKNFVSRIAPEKSRSARRETWGGCLDTARLKLMFPPPRDLLLPHEVSTSVIKEQNVLFTPRRLKEKRTSDKDLSIVKEESELDLESLDNLGLFLSRQSNSQYMRNPSEYLRMEHVAVQTDINSPTKVTVESEKLKSLSDEVLVLKQELAELYSITKLEKQMFVEQAHEEKVGKLNIFYRLESSPSISPILPLKDGDKKEINSPSLKEEENNSFGVIDCLINSNDLSNNIDLNVEIIFEQLHTVVMKFSQLFNISFKIPNFSNPYFKVIFQLMSLYFQSQSIWCSDSDASMYEKTEEMLAILSQIFTSINSKNNIDPSHSELMEKFIDITDVILKELKINIDRKLNMVSTGTSYSVMQNSEPAEIFSIPDLINVSCSKSPCSSQNKIVKIFENTGSQTSIYEYPVFKPSLPSVDECQQIISSLEENVKDNLKTMSTLEHDCSVKEKQILLFKDKIDKQNQIIQSLKNEINLKNETIRVIQESDAINKRLTQKDNFTQTYYINLNQESIVKLDEEIQMGILGTACSYLNTSSEEQYTRSPNTFNQSGNRVSKSNEEKNPEFCEIFEEAPLKSENNSDLFELNKELKDLNLYILNVMQTSMKEEYLLDININNITENYENISLIKILKDNLHRIGFYLRDRSEAFDQVLETKMDEMSSLQKKCTDLEDALKTKTDHMTHLSETINLFHKDVSKKILELNFNYFKLSDFEWEETFDSAEYLYDLKYLQIAFQKLAKYVEEKETMLKSFQEKQSLKLTCATQTLESFNDLTSINILREFELLVKEKGEENFQLKSKIEILNEEINNLNCEIKARQQELEDVREGKIKEATSALENSEKLWKDKMKECIKNIEEKYDQEMKMQEHELMEKVENMIAELKEQQNKKDEYYKKNIENLIENYSDQLSKCEEKYKAVESNLKNKLTENMKEQYEIKLKLEEEIRSYETREAALKQSYLHLRNKLKQYTEDVRKMRMSKERSLKEKETQTHLEKSEILIKKSGSCNECIRLKEQLLQLKSQIETSNLMKHHPPNSENTKEDLDLKSKNITSLKSYDNMVKEMAYLRKELDAKSALLQTCNCRLIAKPKEISEDFKKLTKIDCHVPDSCNIVDTNNRKDALSSDPKNILQLDVVQKAIEEAKLEERALLSSGQGPASDIKCLVLQRKLWKKEKEIKELKDLNAKQAQIISEKHDLFNDGATSKNKHFNQPKKFEDKICFEELKIKKYTPHPKSDPCLNAEVPPKLRPKKVLMEKNNVDPFLLDTGLGISQKTKTESHQDENKESEIERDLNLLSGEPIKTECKQQ